MNKIFKDEKNNVIASFDGFSCLISAYSPKFKALKISFGYNTPEDMADIIKNVFLFQKQIITKLGAEESDIVQNICFFYRGKKVLIKSDMSEKQIINAICKIE